MISNAYIKNSDGNEINFTVFSKSDKNSQPLFIFSHGFKGFRKWGFIPELCKKLAKKGMICVNFDFSLNGIVDPEKPYYNSELFSQNTVTREVLDLKEIIDYLKININQYLPTDVAWNGELFLAGHSLGGAISIINAAKHHKCERLILLASISKLHRNTKRQLDAWKKKGYTEVKISSTDQVLKLNYSYEEDKFNYDENELPKLLSKIDSKVLIVQPENDMTVPMSEALELYKAINNKDNCQFVLFKKAGHTFNVNHPAKSNDKNIIELKDTINNFINTL